MGIINQFNKLDNTNKVLSLTGLVLAAFVAERLLNARLTWLNIKLTKEKLADYEEDK